MVGTLLPTRRILLLYKMHTVVCTFCRLRSLLRHRRSRSLVFVVIIADECEKENVRARQASAKDGKKKQTKWKEQIYYLYDPIQVNDYYYGTTSAYIRRYIYIYIYMRNCEHNNITNKKEKHARINTLKLFATREEKRR